MILVLLSNGDRAEAEDPEGAVRCGIALIDEARAAGGSGLTASFYAEERLVRADVTRTALAAQLPAQGAAA